MKKFFTTSLVIALLTGVALIAKAGFGNGFTGTPAPQVMTVFVPGNYAQGYSVLTNNITIQSFTVYGTNANAPVTLWLYDQPFTNNPYFGSNYVTSSYINRAGYVTNYVTSYIGYNGFTNYYTNTGYWTYTVTNAAATNIYVPQATIVVPGGTVGAYNAPVSCQQGVSVFANTNCWLTLYYTVNR